MNTKEMPGNPTTNPVHAAESGYTPRWVRLAMLGAVILGAAAACLYLRGTRQSANWVGPYLSGAANLRLGGPLEVDIDEVVAYKQLNPTEQDAYHFHRSAHAVEYHLNPVGYAYLITLAKGLFPFAGDQVAIVLLQLLVHAVLCSWVFFSGSFKLRFQLGFLIFYALNPVILGFASFNYYYFWQAVPSFFVLYLWSERRLSLGVVLAAALAVGLVLAVRPTIILLVPAIGWLAYRRLNWRMAGVVVLLIGAVCAAVNRPTSKVVYHTFYVGLAAYSNPYVSELSDNEAYALYEKTTGEKLNASVTGNYNDPAVIQRYGQVTKSRYWEIFRSQPGLVARNAALNFAQAFLLGYQTHCGDLVNYTVAALGAAFAGWLAWRRAWFYLLVIPLATLTFTPYYPPIRAYMYGAYVFIVFALLFTLNLGGDRARRA